MPNKGFDALQPLRYIQYRGPEGSINQAYSRRGVINGKAGKAAALPNFSDKLTLYQSEVGGRLCPTTLTLPQLKFS